MVRTFSDLMQQKNFLNLITKERNQTHLFRVGLDAADEEGVGLVEGGHEAGEGPLELCGHAGRLLLAGHAAAHKHGAAHHRLQRLDVAETLRHRHTHMLGGSG